MKQMNKIVWTITTLALLCLPQISAQTQLDLKQHLIDGVAYFGEQNNEQAATSFSNGSTLEGFEDIAAYNIGRSLMETEDLEGATSAFRQAIDSSEDAELKAKSWYNAGNIALNSQDPSSAIEAYKSALRLDPTLSDARHNLALANAMQQQQQEQESEDGEDGEDGEEGEEGEDSEDGEEGEEGEDGEDGEDGEEGKDGEDEQEQEKEQDEQDKNEDGTNGEQKEGDEEKQIPGQISKEEMARILESLENEESKIQAKLRKAKGGGKKKTIEKQW
jgi:tetratricopeptide (TPR) repeat protein